MPSRTYYGGGGGRTISFGLPPFTRAIKWLVIINASVYLLFLLLGGMFEGLTREFIVRGHVYRELVPTFFLQLTPFFVAHGWLWQLVTYSFLHGGFWHLAINMLQLWMFGFLIEGAWGFRRFLEFYFFCVIGAALTTIGIAYLATAASFQFLALSPFTPTVGASGGIFGVMVAVAILFGDQEFTLFPIPFTIRAKYLVAIFIFITLAGAFAGFGAGRAQTVAYFAHLGGALFGWFYVKFLPGRGLSYALSERYYGTRNAYYRWKRRRAARKFEVYVRKHNRADYFDEYGNYRPPKDKDNGETKGRGGWVN